MPCSAGQVQSAPSFWLARNSVEISRSLKFAMPALKLHGSTGNAEFAPRDIARFFVTFNCRTP
jgi:hypothetical protein